MNRSVKNNTNKIQLSCPVDVDAPSTSSKKNCSQRKRSQGIECKNINIESLSVDMNENRIPSSINQLTVDKITGNTCAVETTDVNNVGLKNCSASSNDETLHRSTAAAASAGDQIIDPYSRSRQSNDDCVASIDHSKNNDNSQSSTHCIGQSMDKNNRDDDDDDNKLIKKNIGNIFQSFQHSTDDCNNVQPLLVPLSRFKYKKKLPSHIVIDCSMISYIDISGVSVLRNTVKDLKCIGITTYLANVATHVNRMLEIDYTFYKQVAPQDVYITLHDAVHHAQQDQLELTADYNTHGNSIGNNTLNEISLRQQCPCLLNNVHSLPPPPPPPPPSAPVNSCNSNDHQSIVNFFDQLPPGHT